MPWGILGSVECGAQSRGSHPPHTGNPTTLVTPQTLAVCVPMSPDTAKVPRSAESFGDPQAPLERLKHSEPRASSFYMAELGCTLKFQVSYPCVPDQIEKIFKNGRATETHPSL